jgi:hypothetical protein
LRLISLLRRVRLLRWNMLRRNRLLRNSTISTSNANTLHAIRVDARSRGSSNSSAALVAALVVDVDYVECVDMAGKVAQNGQADVDAEVGAAAGDNGDTDRWDFIVLDTGEFV